MYPYQRPARRTFSVEIRARPRACANSHSEGYSQHCGLPTHHVDLSGLVGCMVQMMTPRPSNSCLSWAGLDTAMTTIRYTVHDLEDDSLASTHRCWRPIIRSVQAPKCNTGSCKLSLTCDRCSFDFSDSLFYRHLSRVPRQFGHYSHRRVGTGYIASSF